MGKLTGARLRVKITALVGAAGILCALTWAVPSALAGISSNPRVRPADPGRYNDTSLQVTIVQKDKLHLGHGPAPSLGDELIISADLSSRGTPVGRLDGIFTTTRVENPNPDTEIESSVGQFTITLPVGQLTLQFFQFDDHQQVIRFAITGGTGGFAHASGQGTLTKTSDTTGVIHLALLTVPI